MKKILLTFGCSFTEGYGCYVNGLSSDEINSHFHLDNFHAKGWPNKLSNFLKFDKCLNFGKAGTGISYQISMFLDFINDIEIEHKNWDIHIILQLPASCRHSMYRNGVLEQIGKGFGNNMWMNNYTEIQLSSDTPIIDDVLFNRPYLEAFIGVCEMKKIKYKIISFDTHEIDLFKKILKNSKNLFYIPLPQDTKNKAICGHPNESGYELIVNSIIEKFNNEWKFEKYDNFEWKWIGNKEDKKIYF